MDKQNIIEAISKMTILELNDLVKEIESHFGVTAAVAVAQQSNAEEKVAEAPTSVTISLKSVGGNKIAVIKVIREILGLGLMESKALVEKAPAVVKENIKPEEAQEIAKKLQDAGATAEIK